MDMGSGGWKVVQWEGEWAVVAPPNGNMSPRRIAQHIPRRDWAELMAAAPELLKAARMVCHHKNDLMVIGSDGQMYDLQDYIAYMEGIVDQLDEIEEA